MICKPASTFSCTMWRDFFGYGILPGGSQYGSAYPGKTPIKCSVITHLQSTHSDYVLTAWQRYLASSTTPNSLGDLVPRFDVFPKQRISASTSSPSTTSSERIPLMEFVSTWPWSKLRMVAFERSDEGMMIVRLVTSQRYEGSRKPFVPYFSAFAAMQYLSIASRAYATSQTVLAHPVHGSIDRTLRFSADGNFQLTARRSLGIWPSQF